MNDLPLSAADLEFMNHYPPRLVPEWANLVRQAHAAIGLKLEVAELQVMVLDLYAHRTGGRDGYITRIECLACGGTWHLRPGTKEQHTPDCPIPPIQAAQA